LPRDDFWSDEAWGAAHFAKSRFVVEPAHDPEIYQPDIGDMSAILRGCAHQYVLTFHIPVGIPAGQKQLISRIFEAAGYYLK